MSNNGVTAPLTVVINDLPITAPMAEWDRVVREVAARRLADRLAWQAQQREQGQIWHAWYSRYGHSRFEECYSLRDAVMLPESGAEEGQLAIDRIVCPDGTEIDRERIHDLAAEYRGGDD